MSEFKIGIKIQMFGFAVGLAVALLCFASPTRAASTDANALIGRQWRIQNTETGNVQTWPRRGEALLPYIAFNNGRVEGHFACGQLVGNYSLAGDRLQITAKAA